MNTPKTTAQQSLLLTLVLIGWFALIAQLYIQLGSSHASTIELTIRYFSYFTILSNLLVTISATVLLLNPTISLTSFLSKSKTLTAIAVYILIVCIIYNAVLRSIWQPEGLQKVVDELLHLIIPILYVIFWFVYVNKSQLQWKDFQAWLIFPLIYVTFILLRGELSGFYPYPFMNVTKLGYQQVFINAFFITLAFMFVSLIYIGIAKMKTNKRQ
ncbi:Pr6Pr family membrane protein [Arcicella lustrica]|uniref:Pr6Pr family membrane protein n=1 Tax=Arcicella lustrica TaxID=2984196 RepID=A0ABU5SDC5_9BACT|nr:Pr6Pr family membrane protein [Arcicella sp. DC25W]MEA5425162.1 Pr6Pr family membrane protein [Arcicella sp. DC25W]